MRRAGNHRPGVIYTTLMGVVVFSASAVIGHFANHYVLQAVLTPMLKYAIGIIGIVWFFSLTVYNKLADLTELSGLDYHQHRNVEVEIRERLHWFWLRAIFLGLLSLTMYVPTILFEAKLATPDWVASAAFGALALAVFSLRRLWVELEEIRELKSYIKEIERLEKERNDQLKSLKEGVKEEWKADLRIPSQSDHPFRRKSSTQSDPN